MGYWHQRGDKRLGNHHPRQPEDFIGERQGWKTQQSLGGARLWNVIHLTFSALLLDDREGIPPVKSLVSVCWW